MFNSKTWHLGENLAQDYLKKSGYKILLTNDKLAGSEVDIVALLPRKRIIQNLRGDYKAGRLEKPAFEVSKKQATDVVVFVEVKARSSAKFGAPEEAVTSAKQAHIRRYAKAFLVKYNFKNASFRFDVISILLAENIKQSKIEHFENAF